jgi:hypothetical protein
VASGTQAVGLSNKLRSLQPAGRRILIAAVLLVPVTGLGLRLFDFRRVHSGMSWLGRRSARKAPQDAWRYARRAGRLVSYLGQNGPFPGNCLSRSLVLWYLLRRAGIQGELRIGVRREDGQFTAHAWVEYQDCPLNAHERVRERYAAFDEAIEPRGAWFR